MSKQAMKLFGFIFVAADSAGADPN